MACAFKPLSLLSRNENDSDGSSWKRTLNCERLFSREMLTTFEETFLTTCFATFATFATFAATGSFAGFAAPTIFATFAASPVLLSSSAAFFSFLFPAAAAFLICHRRVDVFHSFHD